MKKNNTISLQSLQDEILNKFKAIGINGRVGQPHLQRENASLIIPNESKQNNLILR